MSNRNHNRKRMADDHGIMGDQGEATHKKPKSTFQPSEHISHQLMRMKVYDGHWRGTSTCCKVSCIQTIPNLQPQFHWVSSHDYPSPYWSFVQQQHELQLSTQKNGRFRFTAVFRICVIAPELLIILGFSQKGCFATFLRNSTLFIDYIIEAYIHIYVISQKE